MSRFLLALRQAPCSRYDAFNAYRAATMDEQQMAHAPLACVRGLL